MTVLVVGSTRMLGSKMVAAVFDKGTVEIKEWYDRATTAIKKSARKLVK